MLKYIYKSPENYSGTTRFSVKAFKRWLAKGFSPERVVIANRVVKRKSEDHEYTIVESRTVVHGQLNGEKCAIRLNGLSWGYRGEGSRGLKEVLEAANINVDPFDKDITEENGFYNMKVFRKELTC